MGRWKEAEEGGGSWRKMEKKGRCHLNTLGVVAGGVPEDRKLVVVLTSKLEG